MEEGDKYGNFSVIRRLWIEELQSHLYELIHTSTGAGVMHLENEDPENIFCLSFKTLPSSGNGVAHILEHTVLCGSKKFPVKDPFFSMSRRSLNTFMNAMTGSDFTCYPAASQVEKDFYNLFEVYIDAVFHPTLHELSFAQEGHRFEFADPKDPVSPLECKGIVYNEMKGAMSSPDSRIYQKLMSELVPDLTYAHNSGGDPKEIPDLSYKELIEFHETYYHPSRCLFFTYGNFPLEKHLDFIEMHALRQVKRLSPLDGIGHQAPFDSPKSLTMHYPIGENEETKDKEIHAFGWLTAPLLEQEEILALSVLDSVLMDTDASPLKKALLDSKLCVHAESYLDDEMTQVPFMVLAHGVSKGKELKELLFDELKKIANDGVDPSLVASSIHQLELSRTEIGGDSSPFGLTLFMRSALSKQHGCDPVNSLTVHALFKLIEEKAKDRHFFTPLIEKYFLDNPHFVHLAALPDVTVNAKEANDEKEWLEKTKASLTDKQTAHILDQAARLEEFQEKQEGESLSCLPKVTLLDVPAEMRHFELNAMSHKNLEVFHHDVFTNGIIYADVIFDMPALTHQELLDLQFFIPLWTALGVGDRTYLENLTFLHANTGGVGAHASLHVQANDPSGMRPSLQLRGKALARKAPELFSLLKDLVTRPRFDERERIDDLLKKLKVSTESRLTQNAMRYATQLCLKSFSPPSQVNELWYGLSYHRRVMKASSDIIPRLEALAEKLLCNDTPHLVLACDEKTFADLDKAGFHGLADLPTKKGSPWSLDLTPTSLQNQAYTIASPVAFTAEGFAAPSFAHKDSAALSAACPILENKVLHHRIREIGGAYGSGASYNPLWGNFYFYAYRDPHLTHTLRAFSQSVEEIASGQFDDDDLEQAKLKIIQSFDTPISPGSRGITAYIWERDGKTRQLRQDARDQLMALNAKQVSRAIEKHILPQLNQGVVVTFAGQELLNRELPNLDLKVKREIP